MCHQYLFWGMPLCAVAYLYAAHLHSWLFVYAVHVAHMTLCMHVMDLVVFIVL